ncbi:PapD-like protein [Radiomyces spectabilis]|uniref:PapD-like protein n=1 Tax=Radiomyces spectabilis TaxID=64574 RepID=UPI00221ECA91|nr:PapD-like protein [Radiomyces spectabilis]KAI8364716.1 PapD-like protein [Radiomyces spectabilis]
MSVHLEPADTLYFQRPLTGTSKVRVVIRNLESVPIVFKVKTTAPKQYSVRPNASRIDPQQVMEIQVLYQPHKQDSANDIICKDKFLIQTAILPGDKETMDMGSLVCVFYHADEI